MLPLFRIILGKSSVDCGVAMKRSADRYISQLIFRKFASSIFIGKYLQNGMNSRLKTMFDGSSDQENGQNSTNVDRLLYYYMKSKRSWKDLQYAVRASRSVQQKLINRIPSNFTFSGDRLYFLAVPHNSRENTIHYVDIPGQGASCVGECLDWQPLLDINRPFVGYSKEEQLMRERKRLGSFGITSYDYCNMSRRFLFASSNSLHTFIDVGKDKVNDYCGGRGR